MAEFQFFRNYDTVEQAENILAILNKEDIPYQIDKSETIIDEVIVGTSMYPKITLKLLPVDFDRVNTLLEKGIENQNSEVIQFLDQLNNDELNEVIAKPNEWAVEQVAAARWLLNSKGIEITQNEVNEIREEKLSEIRSGKKVALGWFIFYFLFIVGGFYFIVLGIGGIGMGLYYWKDQSTDPRGVSYFTFDDKSRRYGKIMLIAGIIALIAQVIFLVSYII